MKLTKQEMIKMANDLCMKHGKNHLLYLTMYGSHLYGTNTENSDIDLKGIFMPSIESLALQNAPDHFSSQRTDGVKSTADDVEIECWSLHYWLKELVRKREIQGIDILFSPTNKDTVVYCDEFFDMKYVFENYHRLIGKEDPKTISYMRYARSQAQKYGEKGNRLNVILSVKSWLENNCPPEYINYHPTHVKMNENIKKYTISMILDKMMEDLKDEIDETRFNVVMLTNKSGIDDKYIYLCGSHHQQTTALYEFYHRITFQSEKYGNRAKLASINEGKDWKAISHTLRALAETKQLILNGKIEFPLSNAEFLKDVKLGKYDGEYLGALIDKEIDEIESTINTFETTTSSYDPEFVNNVILGRYGLL